MSNPATQLVQKLWNCCNMGSLAPARSGLRPSALQNPFRVPLARSSLRDDGLSYGDYVEQLTFGIVAPAPRAAAKRCALPVSLVSRRLGSAVL